VISGITPNEKTAMKLQQYCNAATKNSCRIFSEGFAEMRLR